MDLATAEELLRQRIGLDPASSGTGLVPRAVRSRMAALGLNADQATSYQTLVNRSPRELQALIEEVVIPESWFFRDERPFSFIAERASAGWLHDTSRPPFRALSLPCAGGEEPYSIAMVLRDQGFSMARFEVVAVDVSQVNLDSARRGVYGRNAFRSADLAFRDRYFSVTQGGWLIDPLLSSTAIFRQGNLLDDQLLADGSRFDVVFCRNLLIYFDEPARRRALENIDRLLAPGGLLIVGHAEQLTLLNEHYRPIGDRRCFAYERLAERSDNPPCPFPSEVPYQPSAHLHVPPRSCPRVQPTYRPSGCLKHLRQRS